VNEQCGESDGPDDDDAVGPASGNASESDGDLVGSSSEEEEVDSFLDAGGSEPSAKDEIRGWPELREQIKSDLTTAQKEKVALTHINKLLILRNFATLRMKGYKRIPASKEIAQQWHEKGGAYFARKIRILARHYQRFEQVPAENRGGDGGCSMLNNEQVQTAARTYLMSLSTGEVTPKLFTRTLNERILPTLGLALEKGLLERTGRRWLIRLGWSRTRLKKGVYMDGHERPEVKEYRNNVFLPLMAQYQKKMVQWLPEGSGLVRVDPILGPGEKRIIAVFQDESTFHANEYKQNIWCAPHRKCMAYFLTFGPRTQPGEQKLMRKGRGRLIHVSDFVEEENGRLIVHNEEGVKVKDARVITYPGSTGDPWWDHTQLLAQIDNALAIFEEAHPECTGLFIFDQSSAHASLGPDALRAFDMNKSNGGKQRKQKDTVIPMTNPYPEFRGRLQKMKTEDGQAKGLQQTLEERGFKVQGMRLKCSPVCPFENDDCCMARLLSKQDDFRFQESLLEQKIKSRGHICVFLPKFHCELNPIEMVCLFIP